MTDPKTVANAYLSAWNEADSDRRKALLESDWKQDATYVDPMATANGQAQIAQLIETVQGRFPGFGFKLLGQPDGYAEFVRFSWSLGPANTEPPIKGSDVVELRDGRIARVIGFLDQIPAGA